MIGLIKEAFLIKINKAVNNSIIYLCAQDPDFEHKLKKLADNNKTIKIVIKSLFGEFSYYLCINKKNTRSNIEITSSNNAGIQDQKADLIVGLTPGSLIRANIGSIEDSIKNNDIELQGDINLAMNLQYIINNNNFEFKAILQEQLEQQTSSMFAWQVINILEKILARINSKQEQLKEQITDYLQIEQNILVNKHEVEQYCHEVDKFRDDIDRLEAKLNAKLLC